MAVGASPAARAFARAFHDFLADNLAHAQVWLIDQIGLYAVSRRLGLAVRELGGDVVSLVHDDHHPVWGALDKRAGTRFDRRRVDLLARYHLLA